MEPIADVYLWMARVGEGCVSARLQWVLRVTQMSLPKMIVVTDRKEIQALMLGAANGDLKLPFFVQDRPEGGIYVDAEELRAWREGYTTTSGEAK
jgi:hypothetical protein